MILQWIVAVVAAIVFVGCGEQHRDVPPQQDSGSVVIELLAEAVASPLTKAVEGAGWRNGDRVFVVECNDRGAISSEATVDNRGVARFGVEYAKDDKTSGFCYDAVYPANAATMDNRVINVVLPMVQYPTATTYDAAACLMFSERVVYEEQPASIKMNFEPIVALARITLHNMPKDSEVKSVAVTATDSKGKGIALSGSVMLDLSTGSVKSYANDSNLSTITLNYVDAEPISVVYMCCSPRTLKSGSTLTIDIETADNRYLSKVEVANGETLNFTVNSVTDIDVYIEGVDNPEPEPEPEPEPDPEPEPEPEPEYAGLEMPAKRGDDYYPNAESIAIMSNGELNYTHYYDFDTYASIWTAYSLESRHMGSYSRPGSWSFNPYISVDDQVNLCSRSYSGDYSRGHLIPNASRNGDRDMQLQTFYVTNSVPQVQNGFNGGIWQNLESALQGIAEQELIYIVTGVAFEKMGEQRNVSYTMAKDDTKQIPVPKFFYKVVLKVAYDASGNIADAETIGFWFENRSYSGSYTNYTQSVDTIEAWTGFDFFHNLPDDIESVAEKNSAWSTFTAF